MKYLLAVLILITMGFLSKLFLSSDSTEYLTYTNSEKRISILYPKSWIISENQDGIISIESKEMKGGIFISTYNNINITDSEMPNFILESNELNEDFISNIAENEIDGIKTWIISYTDTTNNLTCMSLYKKHKNNIWFISTETEPIHWQNGWKEKIVKILSSIQIAK